MSEHLLSDDASPPVGDSRVSQSRRKLLRASASLGVIGLAGCGGSNDSVLAAAVPSPGSPPPPTPPAPVPTPPLPAPVPSPDAPSSLPFPRPAPYSAPYRMPGAGQAVAIGINTFNSITPSELSVSQWNGSVFVSYGGGTFVDDYSAGGAWVAAGTGGHGHTDNPGGAIFDFADARWKIRRPADANALYQPSGYRLSQSNGSPYFEINGTSQVPVPAHPYAQLAPLPSWLDGGSRGSVIYVTRSAIAGESVGSRASHRFDLATGVWTRAGTSLFSVETVEADAVFDPARRVYWLLTNQEHLYNSLRYLDTRDWTTKLLGTFTPTVAGNASGRCFMHAGMIVRHAEGTPSLLYAIDPTHVSSGWRRLSVSGTLPPNARNRFAPWRGKFYWLPSNGGSTLYRLTPPANPLNGTWVADTVTIGTSLPQHAAVGATAHYTALFDVPAIDSLAWIAGGNNSVYIIRPE